MVFIEIILHLGVKFFIETLETLKWFWISYLLHDRLDETTRTYFCSLMME